MLVSRLRMSSALVMSAPAVSKSISGYLCEDTPRRTIPIGVTGPVEGTAVGAGVERGVPPPPPMRTLSKIGGNAGDEVQGTQSTGSRPLGSAKLTGSPKANE